MPMVQQVIGRNGDVIEEAKTLSPVKERMMCASRKIHASAIIECIEGTLQCARCRGDAAIHQLLAFGEADAAVLAVVKRMRPSPRPPLRAVREADHIVINERRRKQLCRSDQAQVFQLLPHQLVLLDWKLVSKRKLNGVALGIG